MYLGLFVIISIAIFMYRIAEFEKRSPIIWSLVGAASTTTILQFIDVGLWSTLLCLVVAYGCLFIANLVQAPK